MVTLRHCGFSGPGQTYLQHRVRAARVLVHLGLGVDHVALRCMEVRQHVLGTLQQPTTNGASPRNTAHRVCARARVCLHVRMWSKKSWGWLDRSTYGARSEPEAFHVDAVLAAFPDLQRAAALEEVVDLRTRP